MKFVKIIGVIALIILTVGLLNKLSKPLGSVEPNDPGDTSNDVDIKEINLSDYTIIF